MPRLPIENRYDIHDRIDRHVTANWPALESARARFRGGFAYLDAILTAGVIQPLCRLRYDGHDSLFGFALWRASHNDYEDTILPGGDLTTTVENAFDVAASFYLTDQQHPRRTTETDHWRAEGKAPRDLERATGWTGRPTKPPEAGVPSDRAGAPAARRSRVLDGPAAARRSSQQEVWRWPQSPWQTLTTP